MKTTKIYDGKKFYYYFNGENFRNSSKDFKYACIATSRENGKQWVVSLGNNAESTRRSMAHCYAHYCDLEVVEVATETNEPKTEPTKQASFKTRADYRKRTDYFCLFQPNPTDSETHPKKGDCVIRAFCVAADITWLEAFDLLVANARKTYNIPNGQQNYEQVFAEYGFKTGKVKVEKGKHRMNVEDFCKTHKKGRYILSVANHLTGVVDGVCYDTWNPANKCVYKYYEL